jgi:hypothetical protein
MRFRAPAPVQVTMTWNGSVSLARRLSNGLRKATFGQSAFSFSFTWWLTSIWRSGHPYRSGSRVIGGCLLGLRLSRAALAELPEYVREHG